MRVFSSIGACKPCVSPVRELLRASSEGRGGTVKVAVVIRDRGVLMAIVEEFKKIGVVAKREGLESEASSESLVKCVEMSLDLLKNSNRSPINSRVPGKEYFSFERGGKKTRGVNEGLFHDDAAAVVDVLQRLYEHEVPDDPLFLQRCLYTAAISFPAARDLEGNGDQKSPGTFLEELVGNLIGRIYEVRPTTTVTAPTLDLEVSLPTDLIFDLGSEKSRLHVPVKLSTRERVIQVWAHQRVLDGMHGVNRFKGMLVVLGETNRKSGDNSIAEVCLPKQWTAYQMYIAQLARVYYFDVPEKYRNLKNQYPFLQVRAFADFFYEYEDIASPAKSSKLDLVASVNDGNSGPSPAATGLPEDEEV